MKAQIFAFLWACILCGSFADFNSENSAKPCELAHKGENIEFPKDFSFGVATSAYQIEGAWNEDGKAPSMWDTYTHEHPERISDHSTGDDTVESYHRFDQDLAVLKELKVNFYRFSISWSRVLPNADTSVKNQKGIDYYNMVIDKLLQNNIKPMVTMFHYDMPKSFNEFGGFTNSSVIDYFEAYASFLYETFGDRIKWWITFNDPYVFCGMGYAEGTFPPLVHSPGVGDYICMDNLLRSHARAYRSYKEKYYSYQRGKVGININPAFFYRKDGQTSDELVDRALQYQLGWLAGPIYNTGNYPSVIIQDIAENSKIEGLSESRLPVINSTWSDIIKGSGDFLAVNYYTSHYVEIATPPEGEVPSKEYDSKIKVSMDDKWRRAKSEWLYCVPQGLEDVLKWIRDKYNNVEVLITENGWSDDGQLDDPQRIDYLRAHLQAVLNAINDGCNVTHYTHWSAMDNFEWNKGYTEKFGLYSVNMTSENKERIPKKSAAFYTSVIESRRIPRASGALSLRPCIFNYILVGLLCVYTAVRILFN
uniref:Myrosinase 1 n=1 Tax=Zeugodacus cucurbitae TaxID=28588 RepID=A0A0A1XAB9_ZEUCU